MENYNKKFKNEQLRVMEKKGPQFIEIERLKKEIKEIEETIKNHKSDSFEKDLFIIKKINLEEKLNNIIENN